MKRTLDQLVDALVDLPGIGRKTAQRIAFYLLKRPEVAIGMAEAIAAASASLHACPTCFSLTEDEQCPVCAGPGREQSIVCVVEEPSDVLTLEQSGQHRGVYHVLGGVLSPIDDVGPDDLHIKELIARVRTGGISEVIVATNPTAEGEATANYVSRQLSDTGVRVTRIARGLPVGSDLDLADVETIHRAFEGRREL